MEVILKQVSKQFGPTAVIDQVSLHMYGGNVYGFQGINGSGKTMLMRLISGLIFPTTGEIQVDGKILKGQNSFPESMGILIESPSFLPGYTAYDNLQMLAHINGKASKDDIFHAIERVGLDPKDKKKYKKFSLGMKQRLGIACAIMERPKLLILDEPLNSLDEEGIEMTRSIVKEEKERGTCVILSCHDYQELTEMANHIYKIVAGKVVKHTQKNNDGQFEEMSI